MFMSFRQVAYVRHSASCSSTGASYCQCRMKFPQGSAETSPIRVIDQYAPTLLMYVAATVFVRGGDAELRGVLSARLYPSTPFLLSCIGDRKQPKLRSVWCPKTSLR